ncbi:MAG: twin-arginine translocase TatA/TatE family subunit [Thaumarchaeota archaeon]|nr:twin-arginine translocase TatA/TatE family subunit [Nitrososphaerota archaeon]
MALDVLEWGVILVMGAGILVYGPEKIPDMAKTLAQAKKQFDGATKQLQGITKELQTGMNSGNLNIDTISNALLGGAAAGGIPGNPSPEAIAGATAGSSNTSAPTTSGSITSSPVVTTPPPGPAKSADQMLIEMARSLRIDTAGKTREEVSQAIMDRVATKPLPAAPVQAQPASQPETSPAAATEAESVAAAPATEPNTQGSATQ